MKNKLNIISICSGIGTDIMALKRLGIDYNLVDSVEIDYKKVAMYNKLHRQNKLKVSPQDLRNWVSYAKFNADEIDALVYTAPCEEYSGSGNGTGGSSGNKNGTNLILYLPDTIKKIKQNTGKVPKYIILENVNGTENKSIEDVLKSNLYGNTQLSQEILNNMTSLHTDMCFYEHIVQLVASMYGYRVYKYILNAIDYGVPQNRKRIIYILQRNDLVEQCKLTNNSDVDFEKLPLQFTIKSIIENSDDVDDNLYYSDDDVEKVKNKLYGGHGGYIIDDIENGIFNTLLANNGKLRGNSPIFKDSSGRFRTITAEEMALGMGITKEDFDIMKTTVYKPNGIKAKVIGQDDLKNAIGDAVVPQMFEAIFKKIFKDIVPFNVIDYRNEEQHKVKKEKQYNLW